MFRSKAPEDLETMRRRILAETEGFLEYGLRHPEHAVRIPRHRVGLGRFPRAFALAFWYRILSDGSR
jgi:hypothetical protein